MHSKSDNIGCMIYDKADKVIQNLLELVLIRHQIRLKTLMRGSGFIFDCVICYITDVIK